MNIKIIVLWCVTLCICQTRTQLIPSPWMGKTPQEIEDIIDNVILHGPTVV